MENISPSLATQRPTPRPTPRLTARGRRHSPTRERILVELEARATPTPISELIAATGLHENTVRGHLEQLYVDGYLTREQSRGGGRGRPSWLWSVLVTEGEDRAYAELASVLAGALVEAGGDPSKIARAAGVRWGERIASEAEQDHPAAGQVSQSEVWEKLVAIMRRQGFAPESRSSNSDAASALLHHCPLIKAVQGNEQVVCAVHEGMIEGLASHWATSAQVSLTPLEQPRACGLRLQVVA